MPPGGSGKRKRGDRSYSGDDFQRPSPYRPANLPMAQQNSQNRGRDYPDRGRGVRRPSRGGRQSTSNSVPVNGNADMPPPSQVQTSLDTIELVRTNGEHRTSSELQTNSHDEPVPEFEMKPYSYQYLTEENLSNWSTSGRQEVLNIGIQAVEQEDDTLLAALVQELVQSALSGVLAPADAGELVKEIGVTTSGRLAGEGEAENLTTLQVAFLDTICISAESKPEISAARLSDLISATDISAELLRQELDGNLLEKLGLIRSTFARMGIRKQTNVLYRQANFNLMREESEGFAKLMTELFTTSGNQPPSADVVGETVERVKAMIGAFDLDVGRSLDVVLDVFGSVLVGKFRFFIKFLRASPWWPRELKTPTAADQFDLFAGLPRWALPSSAGWTLTEEEQEVVTHQTATRDEQFWVRVREVGLQAYHELGRRRATDEEINAASRDTTGQTFAQDWIQEMGTLPPNGNRDAAQLLGFKLRFYSTSTARDENDVLPDNLIYLSALLIKIGFISLSDLYPHIWRADEDMEELRKLKLAEKAERERAARPGAGARNALLMAGALADDTMPIPSRLRESNTRAGTPSRDAESDKTTISKASPPEAADQKALLMKSLFAIGALPEALFILGRFPWLLDLYPEMPEYIHRIIHHSLSRIYSMVQPLATRESLRKQKPASETELLGIPKGQVRLVDTLERKVLRWPLLDRNDSTDGLDYRFYWDEWNDNIPICQSIDDVFLLCDTLVELVGIKIGQDPTLLLKLARIGKYSMSSDKSEANKTRWLDLSKRFLLPALSLTKSNAGVVNEVFELISNFPINVRYLMYLEWFSGRISRNPDVKAANDQAKAETKDILKRISKTNVRPMARALAKVAYANPHIVITTALAQIEVYDSIAEVFVEGARYFTDLGYDILTWAMISSMARAGRSRTGDSGMFTSKWLAALSSFAGKIFKRYNIMRPGPILQYVEDQLRHGNSGDLAMLQQIISSMAGIASDANYNDAQLQAMGGGELLQSQTLIQLLDQRHESRITSRRLMRALRENDLTGKFIVSLALQRQACVFEREYATAPLKFVANLFDEIHQIMIQYLELLRANLNVEEYRSSIPDVVQLLVDYHIPSEIAFWISRPTIAKRMIDVDRHVAERKRAGSDVTDTAKGLANGDVDMTDDMNGSPEEDGEEVEIEIVTEAVSTPTPAEISGSALELESLDNQELDVPADSQVEHWHPVLEELMEAISPSLPTEVLAIIGSGFYVTFWQLSLYDIIIPSKSYEDEMSRQHKKIAAINADRSDVSVAGTRKKDAQKKQISALIDRLLAENKDHLKAFTESRSRIYREKDQWFAGKGRIYEQLNSALMEHCFLPRLLSSPLDSYFCFKFVKFLHASGTPNFRTLGFYDLIFKQDRLTSLIFTCTSKEADNLGRFLNETLRDLARWHRDRAMYEKEAFGSKRTLPGFAMKLDAGRPAVFLDFESFRRILFKWHQNIFNAMQSCFSSPEFMHIRNAISVLRSICVHFPIINFHGTALLKSVGDLGDTRKASDEGRTIGKDVEIASKSLLSALRNQEKTWIIPQAFRKGQEKSKENVSGRSEADSSEKPETLTAKASGDLMQTPRASAEDGEVADAIMTDAVTESKETSSDAKKPVVTQEIVVEDETETTAKSAAALEAPTLGPVERSSTAPSAPRTNGATLPNTRSSRAPSARHEGRNHDLPKRVDQRVETPSFRPHPDLPSRPESSDGRSLTRDNPRIPSRPQYEQEPRLPSDNRLPPHPRHPRPGERVPEPFERPQDHGRGYERGPGRSLAGRDDYAARGERSMRAPPDDRYARPQDRDAGPSAQAERLPRPRPVPEPRDRPDTPAQNASVSSRPAAPAEPEVGLNPDRAALIGQPLEPRPNLSIRGQAQDKSNHSRPSSPTRVDERKHSSRHDRDPPDDRHPRRDPSSRGPAGHTSTSRNDRPGPTTGGYEPRQSYHARPVVDMQHGRLEQDFSQRPQSQPQANVEADVPSGPRSHTSMPGPRSRGPPPPHVYTEIPAAQMERPTPTGPSGRPHTRNNSYAEQPPTSPAPPSGVHPDRLNHIVPSPLDTRSPAQSRAPLPASASAPAPVPAPAPAPIQTSPPSGPRSDNAPVGPRGGNAPAGAPSGPSPTTRGPPLGPQNPNEGGVRNRNRHPLTAVNNTLQQAGQGTSIRGRGGRQASGPVSPHIGPPTNGQGPRSEAFVPPESRGDLFAQQSGAPPRSDRDHASSTRRPEESEGRRSARHTSGRASPERELRNERSERDGHRGDREERRNEEPRRSGRREEDGTDDRRGYSASRNEHERRGPPRDEVAGRKHDRGEEGPPYGSRVAGRGAPRNASENKRRRGG